MYAVFRTGGKQYRAEPGDVLRVEKLDAEEGDTIEFDEVLLLGEGSDVKVGDPLLADTTVSGKVVRQGKTRKIDVVKFRRRKNYLKMGSHRQAFTEIEITAVGGEGRKADAKTAKKTAKKKAAKKKTKKKIAKKASKKKAAKKAG